MIQERDLSMAYMDGEIMNYNIIKLSNTVVYNGTAKIIAETGTRWTN